MNTTLEKLLLYQNEEMVYRFSYKNDMPICESQEIFMETKRFLWLIKIMSSEKKTSSINGFTPVPKVIDEMWHNMILFTKEYSFLCKKYLGCYIHHTPATIENRLKMKESSNGLCKKEIEIKLEAIYSEIYDLIGFEYFDKWYNNFDVKYKDRFE